MLIFRYTVIKQAMSALRLSSRTHHNDAVALEARRGIFDTRSAEELQHFDDLANQNGRMKGVNLL